MGYQILSSDFSDFISTTCDVTPVPNGAHVNQINLSSPKGQIQYNEELLPKALSIQESHYNMQDDVKIYGKGETALLEIQVNLSDKAICFQDKSQTTRITPERSVNIMYLAGDENEANIHFQKDTSYSTFDMHLPVDFLDQYAGESKLMDTFLMQIHKDVSGMFSQNMIGLTPGFYHIIQEIKQCKYQGLTRKIYLESKVYEAVALLCELAENPKEQYELGVHDQEKIHMAASIIRDNLERPCSIIDLARQVGVNQTKLKSGFKSMYGNTVFGYLQDIRMDHAKRYLLDTELSVQEIAMMLGYQNASNFSIAFKKIHGYSPIKMRGR